MTVADDVDTGSKCPDLCLAEVEDKLFGQDFKAESAEDA